MTRSRSSSPTLVASVRGAASSSSTSRPGEHITRVSSWSASTDPRDSRLTPHALPYWRASLAARKLHLLYSGSRLLIVVKEAKGDTH